jgi:DNA-binding NtrC family response regulator
MSPREHVPSSALEETWKQSAVAVSPTLGALVLALPDLRVARSHRVEGTLTLGRDPTCDVVLEADNAASRRHARIHARGDGASIEDLDSKNGTFVDGSPVSRAELAAGSVIRVGDTLACAVFVGEEWHAARPEGPLVGGVALAAARRIIGLVGRTDMPVLVTGETGTGKDVVARLLHAASQRPGPFIPVNCAALPEALAESELFGHTRGAFTGASHARKGLFASASGGTLFLDEVGDLAPSGQAKLLRVLEDRMVRPVGAEAAHEVDVRVVSATNRDLELGRGGAPFRADLLARLAAVEVRMPALRQRREDIPALAAYLLGRAGRPELTIAADALEALLVYDWPHNVRELETVVRSAALTSGAELGFGDLPERIREHLHRRRNPGRPVARAPQLARSEDGRQLFIDAMTTWSGNMRRVSRELGISRGHAYRLLRRWSLDPARFRRPSSRGPDE